jgi:proteasome accessory factor C
MAGPEPTEQRLRRLLVMLPWLMQRERVRVEDMARTFHLKPAQLVKDLELAACCGLPPYVDELIDVFVDDGWVQAGVPRLFSRPLRLTPREGFTLLAAGRAAMAVPGAEPDGPLARALDKLERALAERPVLAVALDEPEHLALVREAVADGERLALTYWSAGRDELTERVVTPRQVFSERGRWYLVADDSASGEERTFRVDRIEEATRTGERVPVAPSPAAPPDPAAGLAADAPRVTVLVPADARWVAETYPTDSVTEEPDGRLRMVLPVVSHRWLARLLVRLGGGARVIDPPDLAGLGAAAAARTLQRYR